jgi:hypothetical protein
MEKGNLRTALETFRKMRSTVSGYGAISPSESNLKEYDEALDDLMEAIESPLQFHMPDGSTFIVKIMERGATGAAYLQVLHDNSGTGNSMLVAPSSNNCIHVHSIQKP